MRRSLHSARPAWVEGMLAGIGPGRQGLKVKVGCCSSTRSLSRTGTNVITIDINPDVIDGGQGTAHVRDATRPFNGTNKDAVFCSDVLEHAPPARSRETGASISPAGSRSVSHTDRKPSGRRTARLRDGSEIAIA
ncbi:methyltransferase domain-containing protein [Sphingomonas sp. 35-24ZXX]|uniref:methyltransferase domain-containing protein n=1 Tax=Sphingomonas sp. 35-24ZXX TaxID=1545915 RepID=UPI0012E0BE4D